MVNIISHNYQSDGFHHYKIITLMMKMVVMEGYALGEISFYLEILHLFTSAKVKTDDVAVNYELKRSECLHITYLHSSHGNPNLSFT